MFVEMIHRYIYADRGQRTISINDVTLGVESYHDTQNTEEVEEVTREVFSQVTLCLRLIVTT